MSAINLDEYKKTKRSKVIVAELKAVLRIVNLTIRGIKGFNYYTPVKDLVTHLRDSKTILEVHLNHHIKLLEKESKSDE